MRHESSRVREQAIACLAILHGGIEPVMLTLLAANHAAQPRDFGWIVSVGQIGMVAGAFASWRLRGTKWSREVACAALAAAAGASLAIALATGIVAVLAARLLLGVAMGLMFARANAAATHSRPHRAIGTIYFSQQILAAAVMIALAAIAAAGGATLALATLVLVPLGMALLLASGVRAIVPATDCVTGPPPPRAGGNAPAASLVSMALATAVTMMLWSYMSATGEAIGLGAGDIGFAIALGSLASAPPAAFAALRPPRLSPTLTGSVCGAAMMAPLMVPAWAGLGGYLAAMVAFNAGSAFAIVRFSGWAMERRGDARARRFVTAIQCVSTAGGPAIGAVAMRIGGLSAIAAVAMIGVAVAALLPLAGKLEFRRGSPIERAFAR